LPIGARGCGNNFLKHKKICTI